jgi:hypothetical protein
MFNFTHAYNTEIFYLMMRLKPNREQLGRTASVARAATSDSDGAPMA